MKLERIGIPFFSKATGRVVGVGLAVSLSLGLTLPAAANGGVESAADGLEAILPGLLVSEEIDADPLVVGKVVSSEDGEVAEEALVTLVAWPSPEDLDLVQVGHSVQLTTVAKAATNSDGEFELKVDDASLLQPYLSESSTVNFEVVVLGESEPTIADVEVDLDLDDGEVRIAGAAENEAGAVVDVVAESPVSVDEVAAMLEEGERPRYSWPTTTVTKVANLGLVRAEMEHISSTKDEISVTVTSEAGSSASLGGGFSSTSGTSGFKVSGSHTVKVGQKASFPTQKGKFSTRFFRFMDYGQWKEVVKHPNGSVMATYWRTKPQGSLEGSDYWTKQAVPSVSSSNCTPYAGTVELIKESSTLFSGGVKLASKIGIDLSSQFSRSTSQKVVVKDSSSDQKYSLCGTRARPVLSNPGSLVVKDR